MFLLTFFYNNNEQIGFLDKTKTQIITAENVFSNIGNKTPKNMIEAIEYIDNSCESEIINYIDNYEGNDFINLKDVKILAPIPYPKRNVFCLGKNYLEHVNEVKNISTPNELPPSKPIYFTKVASPAIGHEDFIDSHSNVVTSLDYEVELAIIIGKEGKNIKRQNAENHIFGYTIANDISARDIQFAHTQWFKGKSFDTFCPMGPYIMHKSCVNGMPSLDIKSFVNGELRQSSITSELIFDIPYILEDISSGITLYPGDIILTGTPSGVGAGFNPPKFLKSGDIVECYIEKIGTLRNFVK